MMHLLLMGRGAWGKRIEATLAGFPDIVLTVVEKGGVIPSHMDGVLIATPSATHAEVALPFIERGTPTFIEKPMVTSIKDAERILATATTFGTPVFVGHIHLFNPALDVAKKLLPHIGVLEEIRCESASQNLHADASPLWDWLPHDLSVARVLIGTEPQTVEAKDDRHATFRFGTVSLVSTIETSGKKRLVSIEGTQGNINVDDVEQKITLQVGAEVSYPTYPRERSLTRELAAFIETVRTGHVPPGATADDGLAIVRAIAKAEESSVRGVPVSLS